MLSKINFPENQRVFSATNLSIDLIEGEGFNINRINKLIEILKKYQAALKVAEDEIMIICNSSNPIIISLISFPEHQRSNNLDSLKNDGIIKNYEVIFWLFFYQLKKYVLALAMAEQQITNILN